MLTHNPLPEPQFVAPLPACLLRNGEPAWSLLEQPSSPIAPQRLLQLRKLVGEAAATNAKRQQENAGALSWERGFLPLLSPKLSLEPEFAPWDEAAARLPELYDSLQVRSALRALPLLDASRLERGSLQRAATVLSILAHSFRNVVPDDAPPLPDCLAIPWDIVCRRLNRPAAIMTYEDLILQNWRQRDANLSGPHAFDLDNLELLVPAVGTEAERVFYLTQVEITWRLARVLQRYLDAATALMEEREADAEAAIVAMRELVVHVTRESLHRITASVSRGDRIDPVAWAKTVAPLAVSERADLPGPSGTSNPALHLLDEITGRHGYQSQLGKEALALRRVMPTHWHGLFDFLHGQASLAEPVARGFRPALRAAWKEFVDAYSGPGGFLDTHRIKVYGFIEVAFKVGRSVTIGGFAGPFASRTWEEVDLALTHSGSERPGYRPSSAAPKAAANVLEGAPHLPSLSRAAFYERVLREGAPLAHAHGWVIDLSRVRHPGGRDILSLYEGRDVTGVFARVAHVARDTTRRQIERCIVAKLEPGLGENNARYAPLIERFLEIARALQLESALLDRPLTRAPRDAEGIPPLSRWHGAHALLRAGQALCNWALTDGLVREIKATCGSQEAEQLWRATAQVDAGIVRAFVPGQTGERAVRLGHKSLDRALRGCALSLVEALRVPQVNTVLLTLISAEARGVLADLGTALGDVDCSSDSATLMNGRMAPGLSEGELS